VHDIINPPNAQQSNADFGLQNPISKKIIPKSAIRNPKFGKRSRHVGDKGVETIGQPGTEIVQKVGEMLRYEFIDKEKIGKALGTYGLPELELEKFDEKNLPSGTSYRSRERS
jgi:hypothetical protein